MVRFKERSQTHFSTALSILRGGEGLDVLRLESDGSRDYRPNLIYQLNQQVIRNAGVITQIMLLAIFKRSTSDEMLTPDTTIVENANTYTINLLSENDRYLASRCAPSLQNDLCKIILESLMGHEWEEEEEYYRQSAFLTVQAVLNVLRESEPEYSAVDWLKNFYTVHLNAWTGAAKNLPRRDYMQMLLMFRLPSNEENAKIAEIIAEVLATGVKLTWVAYLNVLYDTLSLENTGGFPKTDMTRRMFFVLNRLALEVDQSHDPEHWRELFKGLHFNLSDATEIINQYISLTSEEFDMLRRIQQIFQGKEML